MPFELLNQPASLRPLTPEHSPAVERMLHQLAVREEYSLRRVKAPRGDTDRGPLEITPFYSQLHKAGWKGEESGLKRAVQASGPR